MAYHIFETPDHLHRGLHLFAVTHLRVLLDWLHDRNIGQSVSQRSLSVEDNWFFNDILEYLRQENKRKKRPLSTKEAQEFFKKYPKFRKPGTGQGWGWYISDYEPLSRQEEALLSDLDEEYEEVELCGELHDWPAVLGYIEAVRVAIDTQSIERICGELEHLVELLYDTPEPPSNAMEALITLYDLLNSGLKSKAVILDDDANEAYEVTRLCGGHFRQWARQDINKIRKMPPRDFEYLVAELLAQHGLQHVQTTPIVADHGVDIIACHIIDGNKIKYIVQCKRFATQNKVDVSVVRELVGTKMDTGACYALLITTSEFTRPAREFAARSRTQPWGVRIVDYKLLKKLLEYTD
jgi:HJR/Mrr/RecB family endonuclease